MCETKPKRRMFDYEEAWCNSCVRLLDHALFQNHGRNESNSRWAGCLDENYKILFSSNHYALKEEDTELTFQGSFLDFIHEEDIKSVEDSLKQIKNFLIPRKVRFRLWLDNQAPVPMEGIFNLCTVFEQPLFFFEMRMVGNESQEDLEDIYNKYQLLFDYHPGAVYCLNLEGRFTHVNRGCELISGYSKEELLGRSFEELIWEQDLDRTISHFLNAVNGKPSTFEINICGKEGQLININVTNFPIIYKDEIVAIFGIAIDITERIYGQHHANKLQSDEKLTKREQEVYQLVGEGRSNKEIAELLCISENTVKNHVSNIFTKLNISDRSQINLIQNDV